MNDNKIITGNDILLLRSRSNSGNLNLVINDVTPIIPTKNKNETEDIHEILSSIFDE